MPTVRTGPVVGLTGQLVVLAVARRHRRAGPGRWLAGVGYGLVTCVALTVACIGRRGQARPADRVTLARAAWSAG